MDTQTMICMPLMYFGEILYFKKLTHHDGLVVLLFDLLCPQLFRLLQLVNLTRVFSHNLEKHTLSIIYIYAYDIHGNLINQQSMCWQEQYLVNDADLDKVGHSKVHDVVFPRQLEDDVRM